MSKFGKLEDAGSISQQGIDDQYLQSQINEIRDRLEDNTTLSVAGATPEPCTPDFILGYQTVKKNRLRAQMCANVSPGTARLKTVVCRADKRTDQDTFDLYTVNDVYQLEETQSSSGHVEYPFSPPLDYNTVYDLVRLVGIDEDGGRLLSPSTDPVYNTAPILQFTTPPPYGSVSAPHIGNIIENKTDDVTKAFDAFIVAQIIAPASSTFTQSGVSCTTNSTTVTRTSPFSGVVTGQAITINGETHLIQSVVGNSLTVDFPFKQTLSAQTATIGTLQTWSEIDAIRVVAKFRLTDDAGTGKALTHSYYFTDADASSTSIQFRVNGFIAARKYNWMTNAIISDSGRVSINPLVTQTFVAGNFTIDTAGLPELTGPVWKYEPVDPNNDGLRNTYFFINQPSPPVALDNVEIQRRIVGTGTITYIINNPTISGSNTRFQSEIGIGDTIAIGGYLAPGYQRFVVTAIASDTSLTISSASLPTATSAGPYLIGRIADERGARRKKWHPATGGQIKFSLGAIKTKKLLAQQFVVILTAQSGNLREDVDVFTAGDEASNDTAVPSGLVAPTYKRLKKAGIRLVLTKPANQNHSLRKASVYVANGQHPGNTQVGVPTATTWLNAADLSATTTTEANGAIDTIPTGGLTIPIDRTQLAALFGGTADIFIYATWTNDVGTSTEFSNVAQFNVATGEASAIGEDTAPPGTVTLKRTKIKKGRLLIVDPVLPISNLNTFTRAAVIIHDNGLSTTTPGVRKFYDPANSQWVSDYGGGAQDIELPAPLGSFREQIVPSEIFVNGRDRFFVRYGVYNKFGGGSSSFSTDVPTSGPGLVLASGQDQPDVAGDTAAPTLATNPETGNTGPTVQDIDGVMVVTCPTPSAFINTLDEFQVVMTESSSAPTEPPSSDPNVKKIKYGQTVSFRPKRPQSANLWFAFRAHNKFNGGTYSSWSARTPITAASISRPIYDAVAAGLPVAPERLERAATSRTGHTATTFFLDLNASSVDNAYVGMFLHIPSHDSGTVAQARSNIRKITSSSGSAKTVDVSPPFTQNGGTTPSGAISFELWRASFGNDTGNLSRTGHTIDTFQLAAVDAGGASDRYKGYTLYLPSKSASNRIRKVTAYDPGTGTVTVSPPFGAASSDDIGYLLISGSIGFLTPLDAANLTGTSGPVSMRWYFDGSTTTWRFENIPPIAEDAFSLTHYQVLVKRPTAAEPLKGDSGPQPVGVGGNLQLPSNVGLGTNGAAAIRFRNLYRGPNQDGTVDGWSAYSLWVYTPVGTSNYDPEIYGFAPSGDYQNRNTYPGRLLVY